MKEKPLIAYWLTNTEDKKAVGEFLRAEGYEAKEIVSPSDLSSSIDVLVVDGVSFSEYKKALMDYREKSPFFIPVLLLTTNEYASYEQDNLVELVDMILYLPIEKRQFQAALRSFLRAHNYALLLWEETQKYSRYMENILELLADHFGLYSLRFDRESTTMYYSRNFSSLMEKPVHSFEGLEVLFHPEDWPLVEYTFREFFYTHKENFSDIQVRLRIDGDYRYTNMRWYVQRDEYGRPVLFDVIFLDIEELYSQHEELKVALEGQKTLIREIFHRTRNNMQTIISLLSLYRSRCQGADEVFRDIEAKIRSMAKLHDMLYQRKNLTAFEVAAYLRELSVVVSQIYERDIEWDLRLEENHFLSADRGVALGLVVTELIQNSFKHAFSGMEKPAITIVFREKEGMLQLEYKDNGTWHEPAGGEEHLGLHLITTLVNGTLRGSYERVEGPHFHAIVRFPDEKARG